MTKLRPTSRPQTLGFSMVEVLVVISIILVLTSILLPALTAAKERSIRADSANRLRQLGLAAVLYADDHDQYLPFYRNHEVWLWGRDPEVSLSGFPTDSKQPQMLVRVLLPYCAGENQIWFSPGDQYAKKYHAFGHINHLHSSFRYFAYPDGYNYDLDLSFPLVTNALAMDGRGVLFGEPVDTVAGRMRSYWNAPVSQSVHIDTHVSTFKIR